MPRHAALRSFATSWQEGFASNAGKTAQQLISTTLASSLTADWYLHHDIKEVPVGEENKRLFHRKLENIHSRLMEVHRDTKNFPTSISGAERETVHRELLSLVLPVGHRIGTGCIVDSEGGETDQIDAVIEDVFSLSFPVVGNAHRLYLADSVAMAFEIKSNLGRQGEKALEQCYRIRSLKRSGRNDGEGYLDPIPTFIIAFQGPKFTSKHDHKYLNTRTGTHPNGVLVIDKEHFTGRVPGVETIYHGKGKAQSILAFLCCVVDTLKLTSTRQWQLFDYKDLLHTTR
jgi:hypothetical protein